MRDETRDEAREQDRRLVPDAGMLLARHMAAGATVSIPPRPAAGAPLGPTTLHARLALLRPRPVRLRPAEHHG
jgi:hypothetical protein